MWGSCYGGGLYDARLHHTSASVGKTEKSSGVYPCSIYGCAIECTFALSPTPSRPPIILAFLRTPRSLGLSPVLTFSTSLGLSGTSMNTSCRSCWLRSKYTIESRRRSTWPYFAIVRESPGGAVAKTATRSISGGRFEMVANVYLSGAFTQGQPERLRTESRTRASRLTQARPCRRSARTVMARAQSGLAGASPHRRLTDVDVDVSGCGPFHPCFLFAARFLWP
jgi:hypothetical protein